MKYIGLGIVLGILFGATPGVILIEVFDFTSLDYETVMGCAFMDGVIGMFIGGIISATSKPDKYETKLHLLTKQDE